MWRAHAIPRNSRPGGRRAGPFGALARAFDHQRGAGLGVRLPRQREQHGRRMLHRAPQAEPGGERDAARRRRRGVAEVHRHDAEAAALNQQVGRLEGMFGVFARNEPRSHGRGGPRRRRPTPGRRHRRHRPARRFRRAPWRRRGSQCSRLVRPEEAGPTISVRQPRGRLDFGDAGGDDFRLGTCLPEDRFELLFEDRRRHCIRLFFACTIFLQATDEVSSGVRGLSKPSYSALSKGRPSTRRGQSSSTGRRRCELPRV